MKKLFHSKKVLRYLGLVLFISGSIILMTIAVENWKCSTLDIIVKFPEVVIPGFIIWILGFIFLNLSNKK